MGRTSSAEILVPRNRTDLILGSFKSKDSLLSKDHRIWRSAVTPPLTAIQRQRPASTLTDAASEIGILPSTLRILLQAEGKIIEGNRKGSAGRLQRDDIIRLKEAFADSINFAGIPSLLGVGRKIAVKLRDAGTIPVWIPGGKHGTKHRYLYKRRDVEAWVNVLIGDVPQQSEIPSSCILLADAPNRYHIPIDVLVQAIGDRRIDVVASLRDRPKFGGAILCGAQVDVAVPIAIRMKMGAQQRGPRGPYAKKRLGVYEP